MKKIIAIFFFVSIALSLTACKESDNDTSSANAEQNALPSYEVFTFNNFEITLVDNAEIVTFKRFEWSTEEESAVRVPITLTNLNDDSNILNSQRVNFFGPNEVEVRSFHSFFDDNIINERIRGGATVDSHLYFEYVGNGDYFIEFMSILGESHEFTVSVAV